MLAVARVKELAVSIEGKNPAEKAELLKKYVITTHTTLIPKS
jgi:hypothetical protein